MEIYPEKYDQLELSSNEKSFLRTVGRAFDDSGLGYYVLKINPRKKELSAGQAELFNLLVCQDGLLLFRFIEIDNAAVAKLTIEANAQRGVFEGIENDIYEKLAASK